MVQINRISLIKKITRRNNSLYGNPAWYVEFVDESGTLFHGKTASNAACGYLLDENSVDKIFAINFHMTRLGNIIIDYVTKI